MENIKIRKHTFESNSSSSHTIFISEDVLLLDTSLLPDENGDLTLIGGEFGWEWERYNNAVTKANYAAIESSGVDRGMLIEVLMEQTGAKNIIFNFSDDYWSDEFEHTAYIDHDSTGNLGEKINSKEDLRNYIFNPNCWLITGNDNSDGPYDIFNFPTTKENGEVVPFKYVREIKLNGLTQSMKIGEKIDIEKTLDDLSNLIYGFYYDKNGKCLNGKKGDCYSLEDYALSDFYKQNQILDLQNKFIILFSNTIMERDIQELFQIKLHKSKLITEKNNAKSKDYKELNWRVKSDLQKELLKQNIEKYIIKLPIEVNDLIEEEQNEG